MAKEAELEVTATSSVMHVERNREADACSEDRTSMETTPEMDRNAFRNNGLREKETYRRFGSVETVASEKWQRYCLSKHRCATDGAKNAVLARQAS